VQEIDAMLAAIPAMLDGQFAAIGQWALRYRLPRPLNLMNLAMDCASYASSERLVRIEREAPSALLGNAINFPLPDLCDVRGLPRLSDAYRSPVNSDVRALLISGTFDGRTPGQNARDAARGLSRAKVLEIEHASHGLFREPAVLDAILAFIR
jgi:pimeloyl-ACP methyl ester carboxylesterase